MFAHDSGHCSTFIIGTIDGAFAPQTPKHIERDGSWSEGDQSIRIRKHSRPTARRILFSMERSLEGGTSNLGSSEVFCEFHVNDHPDENLMDGLWFVFF